jgi:phage tail-like protein
MTCVRDTPTFRLLDGLVGWDVSAFGGAVENLTGVKLLGIDDPGGIRLAAVAPGGVSPAAVLAHLPPARLARGCRPCVWYLVTPAPPRSRLLVRGTCNPAWQPAWPTSCDPHLLHDAVAVAAGARLVAVADRGAGCVWVLTRRGLRVVGILRAAHPRAVAIAPWGDVLVAATGRQAILRFGPAGERRGEIQLPTADPVERIAAGRDCTIWVVTMRPDFELELWRATLDDPQFRRATTERLAASLPASSVTAACETGFCLGEIGANGMPLTTCFTWDGCPVDPGRITMPPPPAVQARGQLLTGAIDSGVDRCRWHRAEVDADAPPGTAIEIKVATSEVARPLPQGDPSKEGDWNTFAAGVPHPSDWQRQDAGDLDFLVRQPPGRYLFVCVRLSSADGRTTPVVRRIRLEFERVTSIEYLPAVYRETPPVEDFTERFLSLFDRAIADVDVAIARAPALLDPGGVPDQVLPWLGSFFDLAFEPGWSPERRRALLRAAPRLYRRRGTVAGLRAAIEAVFGVRPAILELAPTRAWAGLRRGSTLGGVRLFGTARERLRLGRSPLCASTIRSYGDPNDDARQREAYRFRVLMPGGPLATPDGRARLQRLVDAQKPAHTVAATRVGGSGFVVGHWSAVGVDTVFGALAPPVLGGAAGNVRLRRMSILWPGTSGAASGIVVGGSARVGITTVME